MYLFQSDENYLETSIGVSLATPVIPNYACKVFLKKDFSIVENIFNVGFEIQDNFTNYNFHLETLSQSDKNNFINSKAKIQTNIIPIKIAHTSILITRIPNPVAAFEIGYTGNDGLATELKARATKKREIVTFDLTTPIEEFRNISLLATLSEKEQPGKYSVRGSLTQNAVTFQVDGTMSLKSDIPVQIDLLLKPSDGSSTNGHITYLATSTDGGIGTTFKGRVSRGNRFTQLGGGFSCRSRFDWVFAAAILSSEPAIGQISINTTMKPDSSGKYIGNLEFYSPWKELEIDALKLTTEIKLTADSGDITTSYSIPSVSGTTKTSWSWILLEDMQFALQSKSQRTSGGARHFETGMRYKNPNKNMQRMVIGADLNVDSLWK